MNGLAASKTELGGPTALRILLGAQLRRLREQGGVSRGDAARAIRATESKISRLELGRSGFKQRDVADLLTLFGISADEDRESLLSLARRASAPGWWQQYHDVIPPWLELYIGLEEAASVLRTYEVQFVHGLMQTEDYARAVVGLRHSAKEQEQIERRVALRMRRQQLLQRESPRLWSVIDEAALRRPLGGRRVMRAQLEHLIALSDLPNLTLQVVPFQAGGHPAAGGAFTLLRFAQPEIADLVYIEQVSSALYLDKRPDVENYTQIMNELSVQAAPRDATRDILAGILADT
ncbi:helix-turn-helix domain-containing protein [Actinomadura rugatobispora]|uniref:Helix-turn-helix domain-containing protein n=1 Tax=Actinomadura rugatobispora TaxID=1994 RepID=A0ABW1ABU8_9ACTN|nr:helix-turn-helix transcriptional regulator [Actinomadura rugatobispora]